MERVGNICQQSKILDRAISASNAILFPQKSLLDLDLSTDDARKFHSLRANIIGHRLQFRDLLVQDPLKDKPFAVPLKLLDAVNKMWTWFEGNEDVLFRVSLKLARLPIEDIVSTLIAPSTSAEQNNLKPMLPRDPHSWLLLAQLRRERSFKVKSASGGSQRMVPSPTTRLVHGGASVIVKDLID